MLELSVGDVPFHVGLLFRIVGRFEGQTMLEWWPRRSTDNRLLDLWLQSLESRREDAAREKDDIDHEALQEAMELYRRCLATNPFDVLGLHWTATEPVIAEAKASLTAEVNKRLKKAGDNERCVSTSRRASSVSRRPPMCSRSWTVASRGAHAWSRSERRRRRASRPSTWRSSPIGRERKTRPNKRGCSSPS